ncbi:MAG: heavy-metal-associated domain-containing protein [Deltaproteobacteria bacterium]
MSTLKIEGMTCMHCVAAVTKALSEVDGVKEVQVDLEKGEATFQEEQPVDRTALLDAVEKAGYRVG